MTRSLPDWDPLEAAQELASEQEGMLAHHQALSVGLTVGKVRSQVRAGRWQRQAPGVVVTHNGRIGPRGEVWSAVLACGPGVVAGPHSTLFLEGVRESFPRPVDLSEELRRWRGHPHRALIESLLAEARAGVNSPLELRWRTDVERPHALPAGEMNAPDREGVRRRYRDVYYREWGLIVELDGREAHPDHQAFRDRGRDNRVTVSGRRNLRYGHYEVSTRACWVAMEVGDVLALGGWAGRVHSCGPGCPISR